MKAPLVSSLAFLLTSVLAQEQYSCTDQRDICSNICYYQICLHPELTQYTLDRASPGPANRRVAAGVTPATGFSPARRRPCASMGVWSAVAGESTDEFPFATFLEGGRTPTGDGATLMCVDGGQQSVQGNVLRGIYSRHNNGDVFELMLTETDGIPWCDPSATPTAGSCNSQEFPGFHFFDQDGVYCSWDVDSPTPGDIRCVAADGSGDVDPPARLRKRMVERTARDANWTALLHIREPELAERMANRPVTVPFEA